MAAVYAFAASSRSVSREVLEADLTYQRDILQGVSRTFALTIPQLPPGLRDAVGNAYLLCRIADTIEDEPALDPDDKRRFAESFIEVVGGTASAEAFAAALHPLLSARMLDSEKELVYNTSRVIRVTESFGSSQRKAMQRCVRIMSRGIDPERPRQPAAA
jgi:farnesyl-diphosphate farnesyltransferase